MWAVITIAAALLQSFRNAGQKRLGSSVDSLLVTWVRFLFGLPLALMLALFLLHDVAWVDSVSGQYFLTISGAAFFQFTAALLGVMLFQRRNFAVGVTLTKTEVLFVAIFGLLILGDQISLYGWLAVVLGLLGVLLISVCQVGLSFKQLLAKLDTPSALLGIASGACFGLCSVFVRQSNLSLVGLQPIQQSVLSLVCVLALQSLMGGVFIASKNKQLFTAIRPNFKACVFIGVTSMLGSLGWFTAFALQNATYVKTLGNIEIIFVMLMTWHYFKEKVSVIEYVAIALIIISVVMVMWL